MFSYMKLLQLMMFYQGLYISVLFAVFNVIVFSFVTCIFFYYMMVALMSYLAFCKVGHRVPFLVLIDLVISCANYVANYGITLF